MPVQPHNTAPHGDAQSRRPITDVEFGVQILFRWTCTVSWLIASACAISLLRLPSTRTE